PYPDGVVGARPAPAGKPRGCREQRRRRLPRQPVAPIRPEAGLLPPRSLCRQRARRLAVRNLADRPPPRRRNPLPLEPLAGGSRQTDQPWMTTADTNGSASWKRRAAEGGATRAAPRRIP